MKKLLALVALVTGCATDSTDAILLGQWGGKGLGITASATSVIVDLPCGSATHPASALIDGEGEFAFEATVHQFYGDYDINLSGRTAGKFLEVQIYAESARPGNDAERRLLINGVTPDFTDYVCLGATP